MRCVTGWLLSYDPAFVKTYDKFSKAYDCLRILLMAFFVALPILHAIAVEQGNFVRSMEASYEEKWILVPRRTKDRHLIRRKIELALT